MPSRVAAFSLLQDLPGVIQRVGAFLERPPLSEEQLQKLAHHLSFESMKNNPATNYEELVKLNRQNNLIQEDGCFMRSGKVSLFNRRYCAALASNPTWRTVANPILPHQGYVQTHYPKDFLSFSLMRAQCVRQR